ncbi:MAG: TonB-dependent receptor [Pseudomonadales bacterium]|nr:TonB-dependent receptor [Pseudomonadales bacterium]
MNKYLLCAVITLSTAVAAAEPIHEVVISAHPLATEGLAQATDVLAGEDLQRSLAANIGSTLAKQPGIHSAQFASAVGRPVIHGLSGPRVKILEDRIDTLDVSVTSGDHAVAIEPFIAEKIEVLKGPSALLYGSGAIGGVVNVHTGRIPQHVPARLTGGVEYRYNNNANGKTGAAKFNGGNRRLAWHIDATAKDADDYEIPGFTVSGRQSALTGEPGVPGELPGSRYDANAGAVGASYFFDWGYTGFASSYADANYGLPGAPDGIPTLELEQKRTDLALNITDPFAGFNSLNVRIGAVDYMHQEIEPDGEVATTFNNDAWEARSELVYELDKNKGAFGIQHSSKEFSAIGEEAFIAPVDTIDTGIFWLGQKSLNTVDLDIGMRAGRVKHQPSAGASQSFDTYSVAGGMLIQPRADWQLGFNIDFSTRAPVAEELYSNGPHLVTGTFERGKTTLNNERATNFALTVIFDDGDAWQLTATAYHTRFSNFIYQQATGAFEDGLPVVEYRQNDARYLGLDFELSTKVARWNNGEVRLTTLFDVVDAEIKAPGNDNIPRTPPMRYGLGLDAKWGDASCVIEFLRVARQDEIAALELATSSYNDLSIHVNKGIAIGNFDFEGFIKGTNLTDDEQRMHTSFIKEVAPAPGRTIETGIRWNL